MLGERGRCREGACRVCEVVGVSLRCLKDAE
jgi:hypothetical protein